MSCSKRHQWHKVKRTEAAGMYCDTLSCRGCSATRTQYQRKGVPSAQEEKPSILFSILQAAILSLMLAALMGRCAAYINSQPPMENITPSEYILSPYGG